MILNGVEIQDIDVLDLDIRERVEKARKKVANKSANSSNYKGTDIEKAKTMCDDVSNFVDEIYGEGIANKVFKGRYNLKIAIEVFETIIDEIHRQDQEFEDYSVKVKAKYKPKQQAKKPYHYPNKR